MNYNPVVQILATIFVRILEVMFIAGLLGSAVVIVLTGIEDVETVLESDEQASAATVSAD